MQQYDVTLKQLLRESATVTLREVTGTSIEKWLDVELPKVQDPKLDLVGEGAEGDLVHLELQSTNDPEMPLRMAEYCLGVYRIYRRFPRQILLYVGEAPLTMKSELRGPDLWIRYHTTNIRELDSQHLLASPAVGDNLIAILTRLHDQREAVRAILTKLAPLAPADRKNAIIQLLMLAGLRRLAGVVQEEVENMPVYIDLAENEVLGPPYLKGLEEGERKGELQGELKGELNMLRRQILKRFGPIPAWAEERLSHLQRAEFEVLAERILEVPTLEDLLK